MIKAGALTLLLLLPATAAAQKGAFVEALIAFDAALAGTYGDEGPRVEAALDRMASALEAWNSERLAAETRLRAAGGDPATLARFFLNEGQPAAALEAVTDAIGIDPNRADLYVLHGLLLEAQGRDAEARASFEHAWALDPDDPVAAYLLADAVAAPETDPPERQLAALLGAVGPQVTAPTRRTPFIQVALIDDSASELPRFPRAAYAGGVAALAQARYGDAIALFRSATAGDPLVADPVARSGRAARGVVALRDGRVAEAVADLQAAAADAPSSSEARRLLGAAQAAAGDVDASLASLREAIRLAPEDERALVAMGRVLIAAGRAEDAERALVDAVARLPASGRARWALADLYELTGRGAEALEQLEQAAALPMLAGKTALMWRAATIAHDLLDRERVVSVLTRRTRLMRNDPFAHRSLGLAYRRAGRMSEGLIELLIASHLGQQDVEMLTTMGQMHLNADRLAMAEEVLRRAVAMDPESAAARYGLARTLLRAGKKEEGELHFREFRRMQEAMVAERRQKFEDDLRERTEQLRADEAEGQPQPR